MEKPHPRVILYLGVLAVTTSAFIIRQADQDAYSLATARVLLTGILSLAWSQFFTYPKIVYSRKDLGLILLAGMSLASHFAWWFASLSFIDIGISLSLTNTAPVWLVIISILFYKSKPTLKDLISILLVIIGSMILFFGTSATNLEIEGLLFALGSAIGFAIYLLVAKEMVSKVGLYRYFGLVNITAGLILLPVLWTNGLQSNLQIADLWIYGVLLAIFPGLLGHATYNWAMSKLHQFDVAIATLGEPVLGTFLAYLFYREKIQGLEIVGIFMLLSAILLSLIKTDDENKDPMPDGFL